MIAFNGILNIKGLENRIRIFLKMDTDQPYQTDIYIDNIRSHASINHGIYTIKEIDYQCKIKHYRDEILIAGKEIDNGCFALLYLIFPCLARPNFFLLTNKQEI